MNGMPSAAHNCLQLPRGIDRELARLDHARARDQEQRLVQPSFEFAQFHAAVWRDCRHNPLVGAADEAGDERDPHGLRDSLRLATDRNSPSANFR